MDLSALPPFPDDLLASVSPHEATDAPPGSLRKQVVIHLRLLSGLPLFHVGDCAGPFAPCDYSATRKKRGGPALATKGRVYPKFRRFAAYVGKRYLGYSATEAEAWDRVRRYLEQRQAAAA